MTTVIEKLRKLEQEATEDDQEAVVLTASQWELYKEARNHLPALLDVAEAAQKVPGEWIQSAEFSDWLEAQIIVADIDEKLRPLLEEQPDEQD